MLDGPCSAQYMQGFVAGVVMAKRQALVEIDSLRAILLSQQRQISNLLVVQQRLKDDLARATVYSRSSSPK